MSQFFPEGPIVTGDEVCLGYWDGKEFYVMTDVSSNPNLLPSYYIYQVGATLNPNTNLVEVPQSIQSTLAIFVVTGTQDSFYMAETFPTKAGFLGVTEDSGNIFFNKNNNIPINFLAKQDIYADWGGSTIFLAGAQYNVTRVSSPEVNIESYFVDPQDPSSIYKKQISPFFIPIKSYSSCVAKTCREIIDPYGSILNGYCGLVGQISVEQCFNAPGYTWTTVSDAISNIPYKYCSKNNPTCQPDCKAPCSEDYDSCEWNGSQFECKFDPNNLIQGNWWTKPWFIVSVILLVSLSFIFIVVLTSGRGRRY